MSELIFLVEESDDGGFTAKGLNEAIFTEAETMDKLKEAIKDAIQCHFDEPKERIVRLHFVREEVFAA